GGPLELHSFPTRRSSDLRPLSGFSETFSQYIVELADGGGSDRPELDKNAEGVLFVVDGEFTLTLNGSTYQLRPGSYAFIPPASRSEEHTSELQSRENLVC